VRWEAREEGGRAAASKEVSHAVALLQHGAAHPVGLGLVWFGSAARAEDDELKVTVGREEGHGGDNVFGLSKCGPDQSDPAHVRFTRSLSALFPARLNNLVGNKTNNGVVTTKVTNNEEGN